MSIPPLYLRLCTVGATLLAWGLTPLTAQDFSVAEGVVVLEPPEYDPARLPPSAALVKPLVSTGTVPAGWKLRPTWTTVEGPYASGVELHRSGPTPKRHRAEFPGLADQADLYGTGEQLGPLRRNGQRAFLYAKDNFLYQGGPNLYQTHPWVLGVRPDGSAFGIMADTPARGELDFTDGRVRLDFEGAPFRLIVIDQPSPQAVVATLARLTGTMELPPKWALGYQQCRWSYMDYTEIRDIADNFRRRKLPCDVLWFDIDYMDGFRIFTFDKKAFPDPKGTNDHLHARGFHSVWMIDPAPKTDPRFPVFSEMTAKHLYVTKGQDPQANDEGEAKELKQLGCVPPDMYVGKVWPGLTGFPDFTRQDTHEWWGGLYRDFLAQGVDGVWNDMNEPAVFTKRGTMPDDCGHAGGLVLPTGTLPPGDHATYHNLYGMLMIKATREGILKARPEQRPFVLSRSNHLGGQRYGATWTGDNGSSEEHMRLATPMVLNLGLSGQPFCGPDLGGFAGKTCTPELFARWIGVGAFYPFMRGHAEKEAQRKEPWAFGQATEDAARIALNRRYRLLPYLYTRFQAAARTGVPIMQPAFFADPTDLALRREENAFLCGPDLLIIPDWAQGGARPKGGWKELALVDGDDGRFQAVVKLRPGAIVPAGPLQQYVDERPLDELTLYVNLDAQGEATGQLYEDAGNGFGYRDGDYRLSTWTAKRAVDGSVGVRINAVEGKRPAQARRVRIGLVTGDRTVTWTETRE